MTYIMRPPPQWFDKEVFILEDDELANYKELMRSPGSN
jgi:hypothetical protein